MTTVRWPELQTPHVFRCNHIAGAARGQLRSHSHPVCCALPQVLFIDTHEASSIYPPPFAGGSVDDIGEGAGRGTTINIPMPRESRRGRELRWHGCEGLQLKFMQWASVRQQASVVVAEWLTRCSIPIETPSPSLPVPLLLPGFAGERCMLHVFDSVIGPAAERFRPNLILVSAGFDAHYRDPFQGLQLRWATVELSRVPHAPLSQRPVN